MEKVLISVLGTDQPGILASVARILMENQCNIEDLSQTILQTEFAGLIIATIPDHLKAEDLSKPLEEGLTPLGLSVYLKALDPDAKVPTQKDSEPFALTTRGPDRLGLIGGMTEVMARFGVNITNLKAEFRGGTRTLSNVMNYELDVPKSIDHQAFRETLKAEAEALGLEMKLQHRKALDTMLKI